jgi:large subunit ribosomal protein L7/L12
MAADKYDVILISHTNRVEIMKAIMALTPVGLKGSKNMADHPPATVLRRVAQDKAQNARKVLEQAGGKVEIRPV